MFWASQPTPGLSPAYSGLMFLQGWGVSSLAPQAGLLVPPLGSCWRSGRCAQDPSVSLILPSSPHSRPMPCSHPASVPSEPSLLWPGKAKCCSECAVQQDQGQPPQAQHKESVAASLEPLPPPPPALTTAPQHPQPPLICRGRLGSPFPSSPHR